MLAPPHADHGNDAVRLIEVRGGLGAVPGVRLAGVHAGIKKRKTDLALIALPGPHVCAEVITTNEIKAAPLLATTAALAADGDAIAAIVCNSGCANACTGERGLRDAQNTARHAATLLGVRATQVVVASTGVIGVTLPMDRLSKGLDRAFKALEDGPEAAYDAAEAIMTTDHVPKLAAYAWHENGERRVIGGIAKGSGMIAPNMATMLAFLVTDAAVSRASLQDALREAVDGTFNMISVDGDMSTNDSVYACAKPGDAPVSDAFKAALKAVCRDLAVAMVKDGEGATKTLTFNVSGAHDERQARTIARAVINSSLVKTALYGEDPNWGRIVAAAGSVGAGMNPETWSLYLGEHTWVERGAIEAMSEAEAHHVLEENTVYVRLDLGIGDATATAWGCDLTGDYVRINAHYRT
ncbi:arginine biosynthesis bifunctional protein ArgJ [Vulcanimicrobium alpinum]|uniref:Arginine biosynthesis bifunctional protein ArgJ n=1 Tax=Vulcanimicrobium alpinum TaxID=3016050 RepID=A0AAN1XV47_UNVUL|nr:bifunctional glutamate N-acetyltransferase/amino-acid acetyltransferase ArgJ [Vulcanimicrobium alpinum]BDE05544.1 arginine biosynthesis bifunctional protein ArgJ [Vulcanimicrobium alpinum]